MVDAELEAIVRFYENFEEIPPDFNRDEEKRGGSEKTSEGPTSWRKVAANLGAEFDVFTLI